SGCSNEFSKASDEEVAAICLNPLFGHGMIGLELSTEIANRRPYPWKGDVKFATDGIKNMSFDEIREEKHYRVHLRNQDRWCKEASPFPHRLTAIDHPRPHSSA